MGRWGRIADPADPDLKDANRMNDAKSARPRMARLGLALVAMMLPACHGTGPWSGDRAGASRIAYKPVPTSLRGRPFYVSGYGGADYSPSRPRRLPGGEVVPAYATPAPAVEAPAVTVRQGTWDEP